MPSIPDLVSQSDSEPYSDQAMQPPIPTVAKNCPVTVERSPATSTATPIVCPGVARTAAVSSDLPHGDKEYLAKYGDYTPLQQHILFWDRDADGMIYPWDTYTGFRELGFNILFSLLAMLIINLNFSYPTRLAHSLLPDVWFRVYVDGIYKAKHGSDSGTYDHEGRFVPQCFEDLFAKYDRDGDGTLTLRELFEMISGNRCAVDPFGWAAAFFEWGTTWLLIQNDGKVYKEDLRGVFDGSIFWKIREARRRGGWTQGYGFGGDGFVGAMKMY